MTTKEYLLSCLAEECCEVGQRVSKALRFGLDEVQEGQFLSNKERIVYEYIDLMAAFSILDEMGIVPARNTDAAAKAFATKKEKIRKYLQYAREQGTVID